MFRKNVTTPSTDQAEKGIEAIQALAAALIELTETIKQIDRKVDDIHAVYQALNTPK